MQVAQTTVVPQAVLTPIQTPKLHVKKSKRPAPTQKIALDTRTFLATVGPGRNIAKHKNKDIVFLQGDTADAVYYIQKGRVQVTVVSLQGKEGVIAVHGAGEFFGEGCMAGQPLHIATATATADTDIVKIEKATMVRALQDDPALSQMFMSFLLTRNTQVQADLIDHLFNSSEKRLARLLLLLANIGKEGELQTIPLINQEILAARVGTTRSRINFFMNKFRKLGFIEYDGMLKVHTSLLNVIVQD